jgi:hypothetical protein
MVWLNCSTRPLEHESSHAWYLNGWALFRNTAVAFHIIFTSQNIILHLILHFVFGSLNSGLGLEPHLRPFWLFWIQDLSFCPGRPGLWFSVYASHPSWKGTWSHTLKCKTQSKHRDYTKTGGVSDLVSRLKSAGARSNGEKSPLGFSALCIFIGEQTATHPSKSSWNATSSLKPSQISSAKGNSNSIHCLIHHKHKYAHCF